MMTEIPRYIVIKSLNKTSLAKLSPFLIKKIIFIRANHQTVKKIRSNNLFGVDNKKHNKNENLSPFEVQSFPTQKA